MRTGNELWSHVYKGYFKGPLSEAGPRSTPTIAGDKVFALGSTGVLNCLDAGSGDVIWSRNILEDAGAENPVWGMTGSPLVDGGKVYVAPGGPEASVIAYAADSGRILWKKKGFTPPSRASTPSCRAFPIGPRRQASIGLPGDLQRMPQPFRECIGRRKLKVGVRGRGRS